MIVEGATKKVKRFILTLKSNSKKKMFVLMNNNVLEHFWRVKTINSLYNYIILIVISTFSELPSINVFVLHKDVIYHLMEKCIKNVTYCWVTKIPNTLKPLAVEIGLHHPLDGITNLRYMLLHLLTTNFLPRVDGHSL